MFVNRVSIFFLFYLHVKYHIHFYLNCMQKQKSEKLITIFPMNLWNFVYFVFNDNYLVDNCKVFQIFISVYRILIFIHA